MKCLESENRIENAIRKTVDAIREVLLLTEKSSKLKRREHLYCAVVTEDVNNEFKTASWEQNILRDPITEPKGAEIIGFEELS